MMVIPILLLFAVAVASHSAKDYCRTAHGPHNSIRKCCLQHGSCPIHLEIGANKYGLINGFNYPVYYCQCEKSFYKCLSRVNTGRSVSTRKAHFLETVDGETTVRSCLELEEKSVCVLRVLGICLRSEILLRGTFRNISDYV